LIALSTAWVGAERETVEDTVRRGAQVGFRAFEIGAWGAVPRAQTLVALARELDIAYTSVHNISYRDNVPADEVFGDGLSSSDKEARRRAIEATVETAGLAREIGAKFVIVHAGQVEIPEAREKRSEARRLYAAGQRDEARRFTAHCMTERGALAAPAVEAAAASLAEVFRRTGGFPMAVESRDHYHSIPQPGEFDFMTKVLSGRPLYYWHDVGHARIGELLGLPCALSWLDAFGEILAGVHFHDMQGLRDHKVPGTGDVDFTQFAPYLREKTIRVMELGPFYSAEQLVEGRKHLEAAGIA